MKIIRILIGLNLIIFLLPFFNACSNKPLGIEHNEIISGIENDKSLKKVYKEELLLDEYKRYTDIKRSNNEKVLNGYQLSIMPFKAGLERLKEPFFYFSLCFTIILISIFFMVVFTFKNNIRRLKKIVLCTLILSVLSLSIPLIDGTLKYADQLKLGYYLLVINLSLIFLILNRRNKMNAL